MSAEPIDFAAVKAEHRGNEIENCGPDLFCLECDVEWPCLTYRLAVEAERLAGKVARANALADKWEHGAFRWADPLPVPTEVGQLRAALADQPEQARP